MEPAKVYFTDMRAKAATICSKVGTTHKKAGIGTIDFHNKYAAIKIHFGEPGNLGISFALIMRRLSRMSSGNWGASPF